MIENVKSLRTIEIEKRRLVQAELEAEQRALGQKKAQRTKATALWTTKAVQRAADEAARIQE